MLSEKQVNFLDKYSEIFENLPKLKTLYDFATREGISNQNAIELIFYYAEASKCYILKAVQEFDVVRHTNKVTITIESKIDPRDRLFITELFFKGGEYPESISKGRILNSLAEVLEALYRINLDKLKNLTMSLGNR